jgi:hypothetical protein
MKRLFLVVAMAFGLLLPEWLNAQFPIRLGSTGQESGKCATTDHDGKA